MIGAGVAGGVGRHVGQHDIGRTAEHGFELGGRRWIEEIELNEVDAGDRLHRQHIDGDHAAGLRAPTRLAASWLQPPGAAPRSITRAPFFRNARLVVDFHELEGRARAIAFALGARHIRIVELALEPELGRQLAAFAALDSDFQCARAAAFATRRHDAATWLPPPHTPSSRIICTSMPSRKPAVGDAQARTGKGAADRFQDGAARQHQIGAFGADAGAGDALVVAHGQQPLDHRR